MKRTLTLLATAAFRVAFTSAQHPLASDWSGTVREWTPEAKELRVVSPSRQ